MDKIWNVYLLVLVQGTAQDVNGVGREKSDFLPETKGETALITPPLAGTLGREEHVEGVCQSATCKVIRDLPEGWKQTKVTADM